MLLCDHYTIQLSRVECSISGFLKHVGKCPKNTLTQASAIGALGGIEFIAGVWVQLKKKKKILFCKSYAADAS